jgi:ribosome modulation factor
VDQRTLIQRLRKGVAARLVIVREALADGDPGYAAAVAETAELELACLLEKLDPPHWPLDIHGTDAIPRAAADGAWAAIAGKSVEANPYGASSARAWETGHLVTKARLRVEVDRTIREASA